ncbi:glutamine synthetase [Anaeramoeba flamelloides]|uniref:Glutamine synthetase n=1 Tax=Anaeramoeba flamelloides TaxID=1746091 RepID=A0AAV7Z9V2_9EUKA|nr:glutamine synthetase [Anaeramoeba flamelloides]
MSFKTEQPSFLENGEPNLEGLRFIQFHFSDPLGNPHMMEESIENTLKIIEGGLGVDGSSVPGFQTVEKSDMLLMPEKHTFRRFILDGEEIGMFYCHVDQDGGKHPNDPRGILQKVVKRAEKMGLDCTMFSELEWYTFDHKTKKPIDTAGYLDLPPKDKGIHYRHELGSIFEAADIKVKRIHHECGPGQNEIELQLTPVLRNCDNTLLAVFLSKMIAAKYNWYVDYLPKPIPNLAGNGLHQHILIRDLYTKENLMYKKGGPLSPLALQFIGGMLKYSHEITSVFARHPQTFVRLTPGFETPVYSTWDYSNRSALVRIPKIGKGSEKSTRVEFRAGDLSGSTHLLCAMILGAGLKGIEEKLECPPNTAKDIHEVSAQDFKNHNISLLPQSFKETNKILEKSDFVHDILGQPLTEYFIRSGKNFIAQSSNNWFNVFNWIDNGTEKQIKLQLFPKSEAIISCTSSSKYKTVEKWIENYLDSKKGSTQRRKAKQTERNLSKTRETIFEQKKANSKKSRERNLNRDLQNPRATLQTNEKKRTKNPQLDSKKKQDGIKKLKKTERFNDQKKKLIDQNFSQRSNTITLKSKKQNLKLNTCDHQKKRKEKSQSSSTESNGLEKDKRAKPRSIMKIKNLNSEVNGKTNYRKTIPKRYQQLGPFKITIHQDQKKNILGLIESNLDSIKIFKLVKIKSNKYGKKLLHLFKFVRSQATNGKSNKNNKKIIFNVRGYFNFQKRKVFLASEESERSIISFFELAHFRKFITMLKKKNEIVNVNQPKKFLHPVVEGVWINDVIRAKFDVTIFENEKLERNKQSGNQKKAERVDHDDKKLQNERRTENIGKLLITSFMIKIVIKGQSTNDKRDTSVKTFTSNKDLKVTSIRESQTDVLLRSSNSKKIRIRFSSEKLRHKCLNQVKKMRYFTQELEIEKQLIEYKQKQKHNVFPFFIQMKRNGHFTNRKLELGNHGFLIRSIGKNDERVVCGSFVYQNQTLINVAVNTMEIAIYSPETDWLIIRFVNNQTGRQFLEFFSKVKLSILSQK